MVCDAFPHVVDTGPGSTPTPQNNMDDEKSRTATAHCEDPYVDADASEYEPPSEYKVHWRTFAAIVALAMGNVCAAMSNTVSHLKPLLGPLSGPSMKQ
ncbi:hypothetical protein N0V93_002278 [Gnomoniopsis smithogilvyi]|uniref:Uncharacterized protein n=1 Tax=Gnomoniopsis smithogilvyi TaxID=1191159 RepID=A0A9W9CY06_9PEZI|nr:hypothetical protein N0V93_002278 [Gnomoniopsis smithogilvyi]